MQKKSGELEAEDDKPLLPCYCRDLLRSCPTAMVNELFEPGTQRSVVFRVGATHDKKDMQVLK